MISDNASEKIFVLDRISKFFHHYDWVIGLFFAALVIAAIVFLVYPYIRSSNKDKRTNVATGKDDAKSPNAPDRPDASQALQILDERLARGEIDTDDYRRRKDELLRP